MTLTEEQKNDILRSVVSVNIKASYYGYSIRMWTVTLKSGVTINVNRDTSYSISNPHYFAELCDGDDEFTLHESEDLAEALVYRGVMDEKEAYLEEQRQERIRFESIIDRIGKEPVVAFDKGSYKTPARVPESEGELVNDVSPTFWQRVWNSVVN